jgi:hypothetical protein
MLPQRGDETFTGMSNVEVPRGKTRVFVIWHVTGVHGIVCYKYPRPVITCDVQHTLSQYNLLP